jgi:methyl-accepting chemotaxis protein WspA
MRRRILVTFSIASMLVIGVGLVAYTRLARIDHEAEAVQTDFIQGLSGSLAIQQAWSNDFLLTEAHALQPDPGVRQALATRLQAGRLDLDRLLEAYETTTVSAGERQALEVFKNARQAYTQIQNKILKMEADPKGHQEAASMIDTQLMTEFDHGSAATLTVTSLNRTEAGNATRQIVADVTTTQASVIVGVAVSLVLVLVCGLSLFRATGQLAVLVKQVQQSGVQVNTSVTEIAATAKEQQATANEIAATTTEIGATSRENFGHVEGTGPDDE